MRVADLASRAATFFNRATRAPNHRAARPPPHSLRPQRKTSNLETALSGDFSGGAASTSSDFAVLLVTRSTEGQGAGVVAAERHRAAHGISPSEPQRRATKVGRRPRSCLLTGILGRTRSWREERQANPEHIERAAISYACEKFHKQVLRWVSATTLVSSLCLSWPPNTPFACS